MGNLTNGIKKLLSNKNTVTVLGVVAAVLILYFGYNYRVRQATNPIDVPYAKVTIEPGTKITSDMVGTMQVPPAMLTDGVIKDVASVVGKYPNVDSIVPEGSLFYSRSVVEKEQLPDNIILDYPKGYTLYNLAVDSRSTYGNSIYPGNYIDIYLRITKKVAENSTNKDDNKLMYAKFIENVKVLAVRDAAGKNVFANTDEEVTPAMIIFALPEDDYILLKKAEELATYNSEIIPVPTAESLEDDPADVKVSSKALKDYINEITVWDGK